MNSLTNKSTTNRNGYIDFLRGTAIILVVIGHAIQHTVDDVDSIWLFKAIYSFHMPLFMFISGFCVWRESGIYDSKWLKKKFVSLIIPFCVWIILPLMFRCELSTLPSALYEAFWNPTVGSWFLVSLFLNHLVFYVTRFIYRAITRKANNKMIVFDLLVIMIFNVISIFNTPLGIGNISFYYLFYLAGFYYRKSINEKESGSKRLIIFVGGVQLYGFSL